MRSKDQSSAEALIAEARQGMRESLGRRLQTYANWLPPHTSAPGCTCA